MNRRGSSSRNTRVHNTQANSLTLANGRERKRTQVACMLCRKRKIKCTGMSADGCSNCRSHGLAPEECVVRRNGSWKFDAEIGLEAVQSPSHSQMLHPQIETNQHAQYWQYHAHTQSIDEKDVLGVSVPFSHYDADQYSLRNSIRPAQNAYGIPPVQSGMYYDFGPTNRQLPSIPSSGRSAQTDVESIDLPPPQPCTLKPYGGWMVGYDDNFNSSTFTTRPSYTAADMYGEASKMSTGVYTSNAVRPYLLPAAAPASINGTGPQTDCLYEQHLQPYIVAPPTLCGSVMYSRSDLTSNAMSR